MIYSSATETIGTDIPAFKQGGIERMVHHRSKTFLHTFHSILALTHYKECFHNIFLHVRTSIELLLKQVNDIRIFILFSNTGNNSQGLYAIVRTIIILWMPVRISVPATIIPLFHLVHLPTVIISISCFSQKLCHLPSTF